MKTIRINGVDLIVVFNSKDVLLLEDHETSDTVICYESIDGDLYRCFNTESSCDYGDNNYLFATDEGWVTRYYDSDGC